MKFDGQPSLYLIVALAILLAIFADLWLMRVLAKRFISIAKTNQEAVFILGRYSPVLSWLKKLLIKLQKKISAFRGKHSDSDKAEIPKNLDENQIFHPLEDGFDFLKKPLPRRVSLSILIIGVLIFCRNLFNLDPNLQLPGSESEVYQYLGLFFRQSLLLDHEFPLWNSYLRAGEPFVADPMLHVYNPIVSLPILLFGIGIGYRVALVLSYLIGAIGMWRLGRVLKFSEIINIWLGLMYAFAGQPTAHFFVGQYLFIFAFAWLPWIFSNLFLYHQKREFKYVGYAACAIALVHFSGNAYYSLYLGFIIPLFAILMCIKVSNRPVGLRFEWDEFLGYLLVGLLALGFVALHLLPLLQFRSHMGVVLEVLGSHRPWQIWLDFTSRDTFRADAFNAFPAREEYYAYLGYTPFIGLLLMPLALWKRDRRVIGFLLALLVFVVLWIDVDQMPWRDFYYQTTFFLQFGNVLRPLIFGEIAILLLAGYGLDSLWRWILNSRLIKKPKFHWGAIIQYGGVFLVMSFLIMGVLDLLSENSQHIILLEYDQTAHEVAKWLREKDASEYFVRYQPVTSGHLALLFARLRNLDAWYHWIDTRIVEDEINYRPVEAKPHYILQRVDEKAPEDVKAELFASIAGYNIYRAPDSLPVAFAVREELLLIHNNRRLSNKEVTPLTPLFLKNNSIEIIAEGDSNQYLVVLVRNLPGWKIYLDGQPAELTNVGGYLATRMQSGIHKYHFTYKPSLFYFGVLITLLTLIIFTYLIRDDMIFAYRWVNQALRDLGRRSGEWGRSFRQGSREQKALVDPFPLGLFYSESVINPSTSQKYAIFKIAVSAEKSSINIAWKIWQQASLHFVRTVLQVISYIWVFFFLSLCVYLAGRTIGLADFPIYFFTDEAIQTVSAADLVRDGFYGPEKIFLPTYFQNGQYFNLSVSVYAQVIPYLLFGKSVFVTRFTSVLLSGLLILLLVNALRKTICLRAWWSVVLFLAVIPTWFLHSRTAFETVLFSGFYAAFLGAYLLYLQVSPRYLYLAIVLAALAFYTYSPGQVVIAVTALALFGVDFRYHWQNRALWGRSLLLVGLLAIPYLRFLSYHHEAPAQHLRTLDSYWFYDLPLAAKIQRYFIEYLRGLNPIYWFAPHSIDLPRHTMKGYGHIGLWNLPFIVLGFIYTLRQWRKPAYRLFLIAFLAIPSGAALVGIGITRLLAMVIPMAVFAVIGWEWIINVRRNLRWQKIAQTMLLILLTTIGGLMTVDSLRNGGQWYDDYGLYGMQFGARQLFEQKVPQYLSREPQSQLFVSSLWANGADVLVRFFLTPEQARRVSLGSIDGFLDRKQQLDEHTVFFLTAEEFRKALGSPKMRLLNIEDEILYPNGKTGFYIVRLAYVDNVDQIFAQELEARRQLMNAQVYVDDISLWVRYSQIDDGEIANLFDGKPHTLIRGREANPFILEFQFSQPQTLLGFDAQFGSMDFEVLVYLYQEGQTQPIEIRREYRGLPPDPKIQFLFPQVVTVQKMRLEIRDLNYGEFANIHLRDLKFLK